MSGLALTALALILPPTCPAAPLPLDQAQEQNAEPHWAFVPVKKPAPPLAADGWSQHPLDRFIAASWRQRSLQPVPPADSRTLLRRLYFDLIGLPPAPEDLEAFVRDQRPDALLRVIDQLLASPRYGERWGRHWLDLARYADTAGDNADYPIPEARRYRDYVIDAFNADRPYDQFVQEQLAGDLLAGQAIPEQYADKVVATGFLALGRRYATAPYEFWHLTLEDVIDTVGQTFMGLTLRCARCHDHKYDPIPSRDYYALYGIFESTQFPWAGGEELSSKGAPRQHFVPLLPAANAAPKLRDYQERLRQLTERIAQEEKDGVTAKELAGLDARIKELKASVDGPQTAGEKSASAQTDLTGLLREKETVRKRLEETLQRLRNEHRTLQRPGLPPDLAGAYAVQEGQVRSATIQRRGDPDLKGATVERGAIGCLERQLPLDIPTNASGRLELARWLTGPDHPLTARVLVNRLWQYHFGKGLVATPSNFGRRGAAPTHPELLDWLAATFRENGWSCKQMHRLILSSKTWQLSSADHPANASRDPGNDFYWRHDRRRLEAEAIRDSMMLVSGRLDLSRPGEHPFPPARDWGYTQHNQFRATYPTAHRSVYLMTQRLQRHPFLALFDGPDPNTTTDRRTSATVPGQALYLMNSPEIRTEAETFARRVLATTLNEGERVTLVCRLAYSRTPAPWETAKAIDYLHHFASEAAQAGASEPEGEAWTSYCRVVLTANEFFYVD